MPLCDSDKEWFERRLSECRRQLVSRALRLTRNTDDANDLYAQTVHRALQYLRTFDRASSLLHWMLVIMRRLYADEKRRQARRPLTLSYDNATCTDENGLEAFFDPPAPDRTDACVDDCLDERVAQALSRLPRPYRQVLADRMAHGKTFSQIAAESKCAQATGRSRYKRAIECLRAAYGDVSQDHSPASQCPKRRPPSRVQT